MLTCEINKITYFKKMQSLHNYFMISKINCHSKLFVAL